MSATTLSKTKSYAKVKEAKTKLSKDKALQTAKTTALKTIVWIARWFSTIFGIYFVTTTVVTGIVPFTVSYIAGMAGMKLTTDAITSLSTWVFPALAFTIIAGGLTIAIDISIYKFFKKHLDWKTLEAKRNGAEK